MGKKIYVIYTGGTIGMIPTDTGYAPSDNLSTLLNKNLLDRGITPSFYLFTSENLIDSSNICPDNWLQIATDIANNYQKYDGFVILHGTDTMAYSCSMVSFMLQNLKKPVIFTGSQIPLCEPHTDGFNNFIGSLNAASDQRIKEVCLYFNGKLMRGNRSRKFDANKLNAFDSPNFPLLNQTNTLAELNEELLWKTKDPENFQLHCDSEPHILPLCLFPGISANWLHTALTQPYSAFILQTYGTGNGPDQDKKLLKILSDANKNGKIIINQTQCYQGAVQQGRYAAGSALSKAGLINGLDITPEAMFCKLHYLFSINKPTEQIKKLAEQNLCGEQT